MSEHRASERSLYDRLQQPENAKARDLVELLLATKPQITYEEICKRVNASPVWKYRDPATGATCALPALTPQALTRYRQRKTRVETRSTVLRLIEEENDTLLEAATKNPTGLVARYLRKSLTERAVEVFDEEAQGLDPIALSREAARHAGIEQVDRKLDIEKEKLRLEEKRIDLQQQAAQVEKDKLGIAIYVWEAILVWCAKETPLIADVLTKRNEEITGFIERKLSEES